MNGTPECACPCCVQRRAEGPKPKITAFNKFWDTQIHDAVADELPE